MENAQNNGFQATAHKLSLCNGYSSLLRLFLQPVGRRLNPDVRARRMNRIAAIAMLIIASGCATRHVPHAKVFARLHPEEAERYTLLAPTSPEFIAYLDGQHRDTISAVISNLEKRKEDPAKLEEYIAYLQRVHAGTDFRSQPEWSSLTNRLQKGDSLYFFEYKRREGDARYSDFGLLVLRDGSVVYRSREGWSMHEDQGRTNAPPDGMEIDRL